MRNKKKGNIILQSFKQKKNRVRKQKESDMWKKHGYIKKTHLGLKNCD